MSALDREALEASPLADLHAIATELGLDGFRRLRKAALVDKIVVSQGGESTADSPDSDSSQSQDSSTEIEVDSTSDSDSPSRPQRRRGVRTRSRAAVRPEDVSDFETEEEAAQAQASAQSRPPARSSSRRASSGGGSGRRSRGEDRDRNGSTESSAPVVNVEGTVELLGNGSGFVRVSPPDPSDKDAYISAAQIRRCELVSGDKVTGPVRAPRRSERYPSLVRVDTINGTSADEVSSEVIRFDDLAATYPTERLALGSDDATLKAIEWLTPFGRGSRVTIAGQARSGKSEALMAIAAALASQEGLELSVALAGVRPEELSAWRDGAVEVVGAAALGTSPDAQAQVVEAAVERARRVAARGADAVVLIDGLDGLAPAAARKALGAARNIVDGGSLTVIATALAPFGGESTVVMLDAAMAQAGRFPALDLAASGTIRPALLVGDSGAEAIAKARADALNS
ncbi:MAG: Rho termination factor N-terminal domain-containing protein [Actinomycetota bacterium]